MLMESHLSELETSEALRFPSPSRRTHPRTSSSVIMCQPPRPKKPSRYASTGSKRSRYAPTTSFLIPSNATARYLLNLSLPHLYQSFIWMFLVFTYQLLTPFHLYCTVINITPNITLYLKFGSNTSSIILSINQSFYQSTNPSISILLSNRSILSISHHSQSNISWTLIHSSLEGASARRNQLRGYGHRILRSHWPR